ncbi:MAG: TatD family hydrolase, partial [Gammaproteobacteria bacterium]|nr:TatD family hydrolase [Gammaproteobacteria bacterium]
MPPALIDIGANLTHDSFNADREAVISRARAAGVSRCIVTGSDLEHSRKALEFCQRWPHMLYCTAGTHPHHAGEFAGDAPAHLRELLHNPAVVAVGECGLDYFRNFSPHEAQLGCFEAQLQLAAETRKPVFLHQRDAHSEFMTLLKRYRAELSCAVLHCFTGTQAELQDCLSMDLYIGITGWICDERRGSHLRTLVKLIPDNRLMLETDAPYLLPRDIRPRPAHHRNEPMYLRHICQVVAGCLDKTADQLAEETTANACRFF